MERAEAPLLPGPPPELTRVKLRRLGEGIGKVVYASDHWIVARDRSPSEVVALIAVWKMLRRAERVLPFGLGARLLQKPSRQIRLLRVLMQAFMAIVPKSLWFSRNIRQAWSVYHRRSVRGERLAGDLLAGTSLVPARVTFPPTRVRIGGWPGWLVVAEATERAECTLHQRLTELARKGNFPEIEIWLERFLDLRLSGWRKKLFSVDAHLKNFGICGDRIVLLDTGGLTDRWAEVERKLAREERMGQPHEFLGLGRILSSRPDIADRFDARWRATVNRETVKQIWDSASQ